MFTFCSHYHITDIYSYLFLPFDLSRVPFQACTNSKLHCINLVYSGFCRVLYTVQHYYVAHRTDRSMEFPIIKIFLCIWWNFPLNGWNSAKPDLNICLILSYIVFGLQLIRIYSHRMAFFLLGYDHEYC